MTLFDPNEHREKIKAYLAHDLEGHVTLVSAAMLAKSTRDAPWRLNVRVNGVARSYVLRLDSRGIENEYKVLRALEAVAIPTPRVYGWDPTGEALGIPCFFSDFVEGESLLKPMLAKETWAEALYIETAYALQAITEDALGEIAPQLGRETAVDVLEDAYGYFRNHPQPLAYTVYTALKTSIPTLPAVRFSNGDLWLDNFIVKDRKLASVIDFANAGFSDPIYEFLLPFFSEPQLRGRGLEQRYCQCLGYDPGILDWYHGLEYLDTWRWVLVTGEAFVQHTDESLQADMEQWLSEFRG